MTESRAHGKQVRRRVPNAAFAAAQRVLAELGVDAARPARS